MEPITMLALWGAAKLAQKVQSRSGSSPSTPASSEKCRWCGGPLSGGFNTTTCCQNKLCPTCSPLWQQAGGKNCVFCNHTHA